MYKIQSEFDSKDTCSAFGDGLVVELLWPKSLIYQIQSESLVMV